MKTITLDTTLTFQEALQALLDGKCLGIRPGKNTNYMELYSPYTQVDRVNQQLRWAGSDSDQGARIEQYLGEWRMVIVDHRDLPAQ